MILYYILGTIVAIVLLFLIARIVQNWGDDDFFQSSINFIKDCCKKIGI